MAYPNNVLMSFTRFSAVIFPLFIILAQWVRKPETDQCIRIGFSALYALALALFVSNQNMF
jgi:hypothetical protein